MSLGGDPWYSSSLKKGRGEAGLGTPVLCSEDKRFARALGLVRGSGGAVHPVTSYVYTTHYPASQ